MTLSRYAVTPTGGVFLAKSQDGRSENGGRHPDGCLPGFGLTRDFISRVNAPGYNPFVMAALHACPLTETVDDVLAALEKERLEKERARGRAKYHKARLIAIADSLNQTATAAELERKQAIKSAKQDRRNAARRAKNAAKRICNSAKQKPATASD